MDTEVTMKNTKKEMLDIISSLQEDFIKLKRKKLF
jgi:hypothetical protein